MEECDTRYNIMTLSAELDPELQDEIAELWAPKVGPWINKDYLIEEGLKELEAHAEVDTLDYGENQVMSKIVADKEVVEGGRDLSKMRKEGSIEAIDDGPISKDGLDIHKEAQSMVGRNGKEGLKRWGRQSRVFPSSQEMELNGKLEDRAVGLVVYLCTMSC